METIENNAQKRKRKNTSFINLAMESVQNYNTTERKPDDQFDITGKKIAFDLRNVDQEQLVIAEKIIFETIYYARLKKLNENSKIVLNSNTDI